VIKEVSIDPLNANYWGRKSYGPPVPPPVPPAPPPTEPCSAYGAPVPSYACNGGYCSDNSGGNQDCGDSLAEPALHCNASADLHSCVTEAAALCTSLQGCNSFGLSPVWGYSKVKLFAGGSDSLVPNADWDVWVKGQ
jgi:hypothetical protein